MVYYCRVNTDNGGSIQSQPFLYNYDIASLWGGEVQYTMITSKEIIDRIDESKEAKNLSDYRVTKTANVKHESNYHGFHRKRYLKAVYLNKCFYN